MEKHLAVCPYCGAGCKLSLTVKHGLVVDAQGENGITNEGELCLKGLYGYDFVNDTKILTPRIYHPMIRRTKGAPLERVTWDEALDFTASRLRAIIEESGPRAPRAAPATRPTSSCRSSRARVWARTTSTTARAPAMRQA